MRKLHCPFCKGELVVTHQDRYQDLLEHASDPNRTPSMKDGYDCLNEECLAFGTHTWIEDGDYYSRRPEDIKYREWDELRKSQSGTDEYFAIGSWQYHYHIGKAAIKKASFRINLYWYKLEFEPKEKGWDYPEEIQYMPNLWRWKMSIWKKSSDYGYTNLVPFHRMVGFWIRQFKTAYANWSETGNKHSLEEAYRYAMGYSWGNHPDERLFAKAAKWIIRNLYSKKSSQIITAYSNQK